MLQSGLTVTVLGERTLDDVVPHPTNKRRNERAKHGSACGRGCLQEHSMIYQNNMCIILWKLVAVLHLPFRHIHFELGKYYYQSK